MRAPEKAKEIYDKMKGFRVTNKHRKTTARRTVESIIESLKTTTGHLTLSLLDRQELQSDFDYWDDVLSEIEKL